MSYIGKPPKTVTDRSFKKFVKRADQIYARLAAMPQGGRS
jgi:hypothetical protein